MDNYKKLSLFVILDAYVTKNAIEDFLKKDHLEIKNKLSNRNKLGTIDLKINNYVNYLKNELVEINQFLDDKENINWKIIELDKEFFDKNLPRLKRKIVWFHSIDRYPFDYSVFFPENRI